VKNNNEVSEQTSSLRRPFLKRSCSKERLLFHQHLVDFHKMDKLYFLMPLLIIGYLYVFVQSQYQDTVLLFIHSVWDFNQIHVKWLLSLN